MCHFYFWRVIADNLKKVRSFLRGCILLIEEKCIGQMILCDRAKNIPSSDTKLSNFHLNRKKKHVMYTAKLLSHDHDTIGNRSSGDLLYDFWFFK